METFLCFFFPFNYLNDEKKDIEYEMQLLKSFAHKYFRKKDFQSTSTRKRKVSQILRKEIFKKD